MSKEKSKVPKTHYIPTAEFYSQVIESLQDYSVLTLDNGMNITSWNSGAIKIFQYEVEDIIGEPFEIIFTNEDKENKIPQREIDIARKEGKAVDNRWHLTKNGDKFYANGLVFPLLGLDGEQLGYVKILRDLTEKKNAEDAIKKYVNDLEELNTHKESVLAILSHDLRSPLSGIIGTTEYLLKNFEKMEASKVKEMLELLSKASRDELNMLDYLVEWARIKYAAETFSPTKIQLNKFVAKVFEKLNEAASVNTINMHNEVEENTSVFADQKMLISVIQNIISNALKHTPSGGKITVRSKVKEDKVIVEIRDTGIGMSKEIQDKLFTPQLALLSAARKEDKGAGIGLLLVKGFLEKNGGEIWVESIEGAGSTFYFTLPIDETPLKIPDLNIVPEK